MASRDLVLGVDASTTAVKVIAWDRDGTLVSSGRAPLDLHNPEPLGYEQDASQWWQATVAACRACLEGLDPRNVVALSVANQRETFVLVDGNGEPLAPALVWMDERCVDVVASLSPRAEALHHETGKPLCTTPSVYKYLWLAGQLGESVPDGFRLLDVHAYLVHQLTGRFVSSLPSADPTGLVEPSSGQWSDMMLGLAGIGTRNLPSLAPSGTVLGTLVPEAARACGLAPETVCVAGAGDGQAAALGVGLSGPEGAYLNLGTAVVSGLVTDRFAISPAFRTLAGAVPGTFLLESDLKGGTFTLNWLARGWLGGESVSQVLGDLERQARSIPTGAEGLTVVPYWCGVMNPYWDDRAGGITIGWRGHHGPAHFYRAVLEGIALEERLHLEGLEAATGRPVEHYRVTGGGALSDLWCQIVADATGRRVVRCAEPEATSLGAAVLAAVSSGWYRDHGEAVRGMCRVGKAFEPGPDAAIYAGLYEKYRTIYPALTAR